MSKDINIYVIGMCCLLLTGCDTTESSLGGAALGAAAGAGIGYAIDGGAGGAALGGVLGGLGGAAIGHNIGSENDKKDAKIARQKEELRRDRRDNYSSYDYDRRRYEEEEIRRKDLENKLLRKDLERARLEKELSDTYR
ncbi:MAG: hypothetical protein LBB20_03740 [Puniceicoccales bacterium]|jgi:uncharacterized protein YcfJ|nr:hypothetical protein [Puniceicoccales bacterium]